MDAILCLNAGSSSLKFQLFAVDGRELERRVRGQLDGIGTRPRLRATGGEGELLVERSWASGQAADLPAAMTEVRSFLATLPDFNLRAIGHRVVHGGPDFDRPVRIDAAVLKKLTSYQEFAPLHQPNNLAPIRLAMEVSPTIPQVACFDTGFHRGHPAQSDHYALPRAFYDEGVRRYGFHGLSYEYIAHRLREVAPEIASGRVIVAHLGSGASMCALLDGRSIDSTMGFTALDGLPMGTRPGQLDPGVVLYLFQRKGMSPGEVSELLYKELGLKGLSGSRTTCAICSRAKILRRPLRSSISCTAPR